MQDIKATFLDRYRNNVRYPVWFRPGLLYFSIASFSIVIGLISCISTIDGLDAEQNNDLAVIYERNSQFELARKHYERAIVIDPSWATPYFNRGNLAYRMNDFNTALQYYRSAIRLDPEFSDAFHNVAIVLRDKNEYEQALENINRAIQILEDQNREDRETVQQLESESPESETAEQVEETVTIEVNLNNNEKLNQYQKTRQTILSQIDSN